MKQILLSVGLLLSAFATNNIHAQTVYNYTGTEQTYVVPNGVTTLLIEAYGAQGNDGVGAAPGLGGLGAYAYGELSVTPGQTIYIYVGGQDGFNGGGLAGAGNTGNGGGASDVRVGGNTLIDRVIVAGGGGGGGATGCVADHPGGNGGYGGGGTGQDGTTSPNGGGGFGGTLGAGGAEGIGCAGYVGSPGQNGGTGGDGQTCCCATIPSGGGGGGGYINGGGGGGGSAGTTGCSGNDKGGGGGGAGGSSFTGTLANPTTTDNVNGSDGYITITEVCISNSITPDAANLADITGICSADTASAPTATNTCGDVVNGVPDVTFPVTTTGTTVVTWTFDDGQGNTTTQAQNVILSGVETGVTATGTTLTADAVGVTYQWLDCDNGNAPIAGATSASYTPSVTGNYAVQITDNGCTDVSACILVDFTGIEELANPNKTLLKIVDETGRETTFRKNTVLFFVYTDGTSEKVFKTEE